MEEKTYLVESGGMPGAYEADLIEHELRTHEIYRERYKVWNWWFPLLIFPFWIFPLFILAGLAIYFHYAPVAAILVVLALAPYVPLKFWRGRFIFFALYDFFWWRIDNTSIRQRIITGINKVMNVSTSFPKKTYQTFKQKYTQAKENIRLKKEKKVISEPVPPTPPSNIASIDEEKHMETLLDEVNTMIDDFERRYNEKKD